MSVALNTKHLSSFISEEEYAAIYPQVEAAHNQLEAKSGPGNDFLGWMYLPRDYDKEEFARIKEAAAKIREDSDVLVVAGIGGSYLGARAVIEAVKGQFHNELENGPKIYFCGNSISPTYLNNIISLCKGKRFSINVISKSGTTTETSLAFRVLRELLEKEMGVEEANKRIYATTDRAKGTLKQLADAQGWPTFVVPDDVGGRYSVLSAVGLLPIAAAGIDIDELMKGAADAMERFSVLSPDNDAYIDLGYIPLGWFSADMSGDNSVSHALEYYVADNAMAMLSEAMGRKADAAVYRKRSLGYRHYYSRESGTLRPINKDGSFLTPFNPEDGANFSNCPGFHEGSAWNYTFYVPHDVKGLARLMGGDKKFVERLQYVFDNGLYDPANEPDIAYPYLFSRFRGEEWRTQIVRAEVRYADSPVCDREKR